MVWGRADRSQDFCEGLCTRTHCWMVVTKPLVQSGWRALGYTCHPLNPLTNLGNWSYSVPFADRENKAWKASTYKVMQLRKWSIVLPSVNSMAHVFSYSKAHPSQGCAVPWLATNVCICISFTAVQLQSRSIILKIPLDLFIINAFFLFILSPGQVMLGYLFLYVCMSDACTYVCVHLLMDECMCTHICTYIHQIYVLHIYKYVDTHAHIVHMHVHVHMCTIHVHLYMYMCTYIGMCMCICLYMHVHICTYKCVYAYSMYG